VHTDATTNQQGTWALNDMKKGDVVLSMFACPEIPTPDRYTVQVWRTILWAIAAAERP
jgi:hypothetical protein